MTNKSKLIPQSIEDDLRANLVAAGTDEGRLEEARKLVVKKMIIQHDLAWYNTHRAEIKAEIAAVEKDVFNRCGTCGVRMMDAEEETELERQAKK